MAGNGSLFHGGNLGLLHGRTIVPEDQWLDLSTGINPYSYPVPKIAKEIWRRLPLTKELEALAKAARAAYGVTQSMDIVAAPGSQAIIQSLPLLRKPTKVAIVNQLTYREHEACWSRYGHKVRSTGTLDQALESGAEIIIVVNPNNPDGLIYPVEKLRAAADDMADREGLLIVDEAFMDLMPEHSLCPYADQPGLVVIRSLGKFYGLAGLRVGFLTGSHKNLKALRDHFGPWPVSGPGIQVAQAALGDQVWAKKMRGQLNKEAAKLRDLLDHAGFTIIGGTALFTLTRQSQAPARFEQLCAAGLLVRAFEDDPELLRFGLPGASAGFERLAAAL